MSGRDVLIEIALLPVALAVGQLLLALLGDIRLMRNALGQNSPRFRGRIIPAMRGVECPLWVISAT